MIPDHSSGLVKAENSKEVKSVGVHKRRTLRVISKLAVSSSCISISCEADGVVDAYSDAAPVKDVTDVKP